MNRQAAEKRGRRAETLAAWWLRLKGWSILARRVRASGGEIDLVARRGHIIAFVEVKQRSRGEDAAFALDHFRLRRVAAAAEQLAPRFARHGEDIRIDVIYLVPGRLPKHLENAWVG